MHIRTCFCWVLLALTLTSHAQISLEVSGGASKADQVYGTLAVRYAPSESFRFGAEWHQGDIQYRFVDARAITSGQVGIYSIMASGRLSETQLLRLDLVGKVGYRRQTPGTEQAIENYSFENSTGLILEPALLVHIKSTENLYLHTGINLRTTYQLQPSVINEQATSSHILAGASWAISDRWVLFFRNQFGPTSGAGGDTEKFFWQTNLGLRFSLDAATPQQLIIGL